MWSINNKMMFHPDKCKVVTIKHKPFPLAMLPFVAYHYHLTENLLSYADSERDFGVHVNKSFNFNEHCEVLNFIQHYFIQSNLRMSNETRSPQTMTE